MTVAQSRSLAPRVAFAGVLALLAAKALSTKIPHSARRAVATSPAPAPVADPPLWAVDRRSGAWVWSRRDAEALERARVVDPRLRAAVHIATVGRNRDGTLGWHRALSPGIARGSGPGAIVIRFDDSLHALWNGAPQDHAVTLLAPLLGQILAEVRATGARYDEVELDYDVPVRALADWADVAGQLSRGVLAEMPVWVTSLPVHMASPRYGEMLARAGIAGHILQLFDTGLACTYENAAILAENLARHHLPFRIGAALFERTGTARHGDHVCWQSAAARFATIPGYGGFWIFPAGQEMGDALARLSLEAP